jgi:hypothetical protein
MNTHLATALTLYESNNIDFQHLIGWHLCNGFVLCRPECFAIGFFTNSIEPTESVTKDHANSLFVTYCAGRMPFLLKQFVGEFDFLVFQRQFKGSSSVRVWDYNKAFNRIK